MIKNYFRPVSLEEALSLLADPNALPLGGGTWLNTRQHQTEISVVDLQALGLSSITPQGNNLIIEAGVTLQQLLEFDQTPPALKQALKLDAPLNTRNVATVAGALVAADGRSPFAACILALDAKVTLTGAQSSEEIGIGEFLPMRQQHLQGKLITKISIPLNASLAFETVARTPADKPIVCAALSQWQSGRTRLALGGWGKLPLLAMDGLDATGAHLAAMNAYHEANDEFASAAYRKQMAGTLANRCLAQLSPASN